VLVLVAHPVVLGDDVGDDGLVGMVAAEVEAGVGVAGGVAVLEAAVAGVVGVDAVVAVVVGGEVAAAKPDDAGPVDGVAPVAPDGEVLDGDAVGLDFDAVLALELAVQYHGVSVPTRSVIRGVETATASR